MYRLIHYSYSSKIVLVNFAKLKYRKRRRHVSDVFLMLLCDKNHVFISNFVVIKFELNRAVIFLEDNVFIIGIPFNHQTFVYFIKIQISISVKSFFQTLKRLFQEITIVILIARIVFPTCVLVKNNSFRITTPP